MIDHVSLIINLCPNDMQTAGTANMPSIILSVFLLFLYVNQAEGLSIKHRDDFIIRLRDAYLNKQLFINTEGTCASNSYLFLGAQTIEQHVANERLGRRDAVVNNKVFTQWLVYNYREIPAIETFAETHKTAAEYAYYASTIAMYFIEHLETVLDGIGKREPFFTYMGFSSRMEPMMSHAVVLWYNPADKHIFLINPQDFMEEGRIVYGAGQHWRNYFGKAFRHYSLQKYVEDNMDFFTGLGKVSILTEFHKDTDPFYKTKGSKPKTQGGNPTTQTTILLPDGKHYEATVLDNGMKYATFSFPNNILFSAMVDTNDNLNLMLQFPNGKTFNAIMLQNGTVVPILKLGSRDVPCIINDDLTFTPAVILPDMSLFAATKINNTYILPVVNTSGQLVYNSKNKLNNDVEISVVLPEMLNIQYITSKRGFESQSNNIGLHNIYSITNTLNGSTQYFSVASSTEFLFIHTGTLISYFTWLKPGSFQSNKEAIDAALRVMLLFKPARGFETISFINRNPQKDLTQARDKIAQFNSILRIVCDGQLELGYLNEMQADELYTFSDLDDVMFRNNILLCFNIENTCVSSITLLENTQDNRVEIESFTHPQCQGQQFNKLLRAVSIMLLPILFPNIPVYRSVAVNYLSAYQMITYFGGIIANNKEDNFELAEYLGEIPLSQATLQHIKSFFKAVKDVDVKVDMQINNENVKNAEDVFDSVVADVDRFMCSF